jgi:TetR/AcrR family transcriptional regulator, transcriptional repressor for nem operon
MAGTGEPQRLTPKGRATRERIVETAAAMISRQGVTGTSIDDVRKAAGVSGSQMTHYFRDKRSLVRAVIAMQADIVTNLSQQPGLGKLDSFDAFEQWALLCLSRQQEDDNRGGSGFGALARELAEADAEIRADLAAGFLRWEELLRRGLQAMRDRCELRPDADPAELASGLLAFLQGGILLTQITRDIRHLEGALRSAITLIRSYAASPDAPAVNDRSSPGRSRTADRGSAGS